jgi:hypothetical protein
MPSNKQLEANHQNALRSTGPKTVEGVEAVKLNALRRGLRSVQTVVVGEVDASVRHCTQTRLQCKKESAKSVRDPCLIEPRSARKKPSVEAWELSLMHFCRIGTRDNGAADKKEMSPA